jgi:hypothetical protein
MKIVGYLVSKNGIKGGRRQALEATEQQESRISKAGRIHYFAVSDRHSQFACGSACRSGDSFESKLEPMLFLFLFVELPYLKFRPILLAANTNARQAPLGLPDNRANREEKDQKS